MEVIHARNINDAYRRGLDLLHAVGEKQNSRNGPVLVAPYPVITVYEKPVERVLFDAKRDANPFFHLVEALWMLAGRNDAALPARYAKQMLQYAEEDGHLHGAYGFRWRKHFDMYGGGDLGLPDQLSAIVGILSHNPDDRQAVLTMWDPVADLAAQVKDKPCNTHIYFRIRTVTELDADNNPGSLPLLDMTVCCRSNDMIWGGYGANAVHFSFLQEYMAARIGVGVGRYYQISNNFHAYADVFEKCWPTEPVDMFYVRQLDPLVPLVDHPALFDRENERLLQMVDQQEFLEQDARRFRNKFLANVAYPMLCAHWAHRHGISALRDEMLDTTTAPDWRRAAKAWFARREKVKT